MKIDTVEVELKAKDVDEIVENIFLKEIVRCKDCIHFNNHDKRCGYFNHGIKTDDYCSYGEKKDE